MKLNLPPVQQTNIYNVYIQARASAALAVAVRIGLFETLAQEAKTATMIATHHNLHIRGAKAILRALSACAILHHEDSYYHLTEEAKTYLLKEAPFYLGALIDMENESFLTPQKLLASAQSGQPSVYGDEDVWETHEHDSTKARSFTAAMHAISTEPALALADLTIWTQCAKLLDVGGGSGVLSIAIAQRHPIEAQIYDIQQVCSIAKEYIDQYQLSERITTITGDMFTDAFPIGHDAVLFSQILHDWNPQQGKELLKKATKSLPQGGWIIIHEKLTNPNDQHKPIANALVNLDMLIWTEGQQYSASELEKLLADCGCIHIQTRNTIGYWSATIGYYPKPD